MKVNIFSAALLLCLCAIAFASPAMAEEAALPVGFEAIEASESVDADLYVAFGETESTLDALAEEGTVIGEMEVSRRRCNCKNQCFSDSFCQLFTPGKVCRASGSCGCLKCVNP